MHICLTVECITSGLHLSVFQCGAPFAPSPPPWGPPAPKHRHEHKHSHKVADHHDHFAPLRVAGPPND